MFETYDDIMTIEEISEALKIGSSQAYKIVRTQQLKGYKEGKDWKIPKTSLIEYVQQKVHSSILKKNKRGR